MLCVGARIERAARTRQIEFAAVVDTPAFRERNLTPRGLVSAINSPAQFAAAIKQERVVAAQVVKEAGLEPQ